MSTSRTHRSPGEPPMKDIVVGVNLPDVNGDPHAARSKLASTAEDGFDCVEIRLDQFPFIINGEVRGEVVAFVRGLLQEHRFVYTAHIGKGLDLRDLARYALHTKVLRSSIEVCSALGMRLLVLHYEAKSTDLLAEEKFLEAHAEAADYAAGLGVALRIENIEVERIDPLIDFVKKVGRKDFLLTFDTGHAYLASHRFHFDFLESLRQALPYVGHLHLSDNAGTFEELRLTNRLAYDNLATGYRVTFGRGDVHIPPFWGHIPYPEVFQLLCDYDGIFVCEYHSDFFRPFNRSVQEKVRGAIREARGNPTGGRKT